jgi:hypothetical protein
MVSSRVEGDISKGCTISMLSEKPGFRGHVKSLSLPCSKARLRRGRRMEALFYQRAIFAVDSLHFAQLRFTVQLLIYDRRRAAINIAFRIGGVAGFS